jgi:hypothetical protein
MRNHDRYRLFVVAAKALFLAALPFLAFGFGIQVLELRNRLSVSSSRLWLFLLGAVLFLPVWLLGKRVSWQSWQFVCTIEHELTHAVAGIPFLFFPKGIRATATQGGHVKQAWIAPVILVPLYGPGTILSTLAPYFLPTSSYLLIALGVFFLDTEARWFSITLGSLTTFHIVSTWAETNYRQPDIHEAGLVFSTLFLPVANLIALGGIWAFVADGPRGFLRYWPEAFWRSVDAATRVAGLVA